MSVSAQQCANAAEAAVLREPPITYQQEDCQGFIEQTVKRAGGAMRDYRGSNDMYRNACTKVVLLKGARLQPGMVLFIVKQDGREPERYKPDGLGNADHIGWYTGGIYEVVHSSATRGGVAPSTLKNGWTHAGWLKEIDYGERPQEENQEVIQVSTGYIDLPAEENVFLRISPSKTSAWFARVPGQAAVDIVSTSGDWARVKYGGKDGYVMAKFIEMAEAPPPITTPTVPIAPDDELLAEVETHLTRALTLIRARRGAN